MFSKEILKNRESLFLKPADEETRVFFMACNQSLRFEIL